MNELISVVVPVYNVEDYLEECVNSITSQSYKNTEIILVNDGSTDKSGEICENLSKEDNRIKVINKKNGGLSDARNIGISNSSGEFIYLIDSDDFIAKENTLELMHNILMTEDKVDIVVSYYYEKRDAEDIYVLNDEDGTYEVFDKVEALHRMYDSSKYKFNFVVAHNKLYRKRLFENIEYAYGKIHEDEFTTYKLFIDSNKIALLKSNTYAYRLRANSIMTSSYTTKKLAIFEALDERLEIFENLGYGDLIDKTKLKYFYNLLYNRQMLYRGNYKEFDYINKKYKQFLRENPKYKYDIMRFKFYIKKLRFDLVGK